MNLNQIFFQTYALSLIAIAPDSKLEESEMTISSDNVSSNLSTKNTSHPSLGESSDKVIPGDISLPSQFLLPTLDDSSSEEETEITELKTETKIHDIDHGEEMLPVDSEASSLVNTNAVSYTHLTLPTNREV